MDERTQTQPAPDDAGPPSITIPASERAETQRKRCVQCGGPFGLVRRRRAGRQFCSAACMDKQVESIRQAVRDKARWYEFLTQRD